MIREEAEKYYTAIRNGKLRRQCIEVVTPQKQVGLSIKKAVALTDVPMFEKAPSVRIVIFALPIQNKVIYVGPMKIELPTMFLLYVK